MPDRIISEKLIYKGVVFDVKKKKIKLPNGKIADRDVIEPRKAVAVVAITDEDKVVLVKQYRVAVKKDLWEIPAGLIEEGEDPKEAALRELKEETGYKAKKIEEITKIHTSPGILSGTIIIYKATELVKSKQNLDEEEFVEVGEFGIDESKKVVSMDAK
ncbi:MAG: hypothetical protein B6I28_03660, partial [Fusobacteriia bacterium 4572_132]